MKQDIQAFELKLQLFMLINIAQTMTKAANC